MRRAARSAVLSVVLARLFEGTSSTYTYLLADETTREALLIDPVLETADRDAQLVSDLGLVLKYAVNTHVHADHVTGSGALKRRFPDCLSAISQASSASADVRLSEGDKLFLGARYVSVLATPGHTSGCLSFVLDDESKAFTGDALLIRGCGRTDFQEGSSTKLFESVRTKLFALPDTCAVLPAHDYKGFTSSTIGEEKRLNPRLRVTTTEQEFVLIMENLKLPLPGKIDVAVPANMACGV